MCVFCGYVLCVCLTVCLCVLCVLCFVCFACWVWGFVCVLFLIRAMKPNMFLAFESVIYCCLWFVCFCFNVVVWFVCVFLCVLCGLCGLWFVCFMCWVMCVFGGLSVQNNETHTHVLCFLFVDLFVVLCLCLWCCFFV